MLRRRTAELMLLTTVLLWALNFTVTKYVLEHGFQPLAYSTVRYGMATIIFTWFTFGVERSFRVRRRDLADRRRRRGARYLAQPVRPTSTR